MGSFHDWMIILSMCSKCNSSEKYQQSIVRENLVQILMNKRWSEDNWPTCSSREIGACAQTMEQQTVRPCSKTGYPPSVWGRRTRLIDETSSWYGADGRKLWCLSNPAWQFQRHGPCIGTVLLRSRALTVGSYGGELSRRTRGRI